MSLQPPFAETSYGVVKRLDVIVYWLSEVARRRRGPLEVLDIGCGTGDQLTAPLASLGHRVLGIDMHEPSIQQARSRHAIAGLRFETRDIADLDQQTGLFDVVVCSEVLEHLDNPGAFLTRIRALLRSDGALVITTPNGYGTYEWLSTLERSFRRIGVHQALRWLFWQGRRAVSRARRDPLPTRPLERLTEAGDAGFLNTDSGHVQFFTLRRLERLFQESGYEIEDRRARTLLCGPYVDALFALLPNRARAYAWNSTVADRLPLQLAADWMLLARPRR